MLSVQKNGDLSLVSQDVEKDSKTAYFNADGAEVSSDKDWLVLAHWVQIQKADGGWENKLMVCFKKAMYQGCHPDANTVNVYTNLPEKVWPSVLVFIKKQPGFGRTNLGRVFRLVCANKDYSYTPQGKNYEIHVKKGRGVMVETKLNGNKAFFIKRFDTPDEEDTTPILTGGVYAMMIGVSGKRGVFWENLFAPYVQNATETQRLEAVPAILRAHIIEQRQLREETQQAKLAEPTKA
jgi:hypothetical protein